MKKLESNQSSMFTTLGGRGEGLLDGERLNKSSTSSALTGGIPPPQTITDAATLPW